MPGQYKKRIDAGLCGNCGQRPPIEGKKACEKCGKDAAERSKNSRQARLDKGMCRQCGKNPVDGNKLTCFGCSKLFAEYRVKQRADMKAAAFNAYGGPKCKCCGETNPGFLTLDHIEGGGNKHRKSIKHGGRGGLMYVWAAKNNYPPIFQVL